MRFNNSTNKHFNFLIIFLSIIVISSCERDDICIDPITPNLIIRFYDKDDPTKFKSISNLEVNITGVNSTLTLSGDSIALPVKITENLSEYTLTKNIDAATKRTDKFSLNYTREQLFVGRSCGYKTLFKNITLLNNVAANTWIARIEVTNPFNIENETNAHVKILH